MLYKRVGNAATADQLRELQVEMIDRFGLLPEYVKNLFRVSALRQQADGLGIARLEAGATAGKIEFSKHTSVEPMTIVDMVQQHPDCYRLQGAKELKFNADMFSAEQRLQAVTALLDQLTPTRQVA